MDDGMPASSTVRLWVSEDREGFAKRYAHAREIGRPPRGGRMTLYTKELADLLLDELAEGRTLSAICRDPGMPNRTTVRLWVREDREGFAKCYSQAREFGYHAMMDEIIDIADDASGDWKDGTTETVRDPGNIKRSRLRIGSRRWLLSNALPRLYGDRLDLNARYDDRE